MLVSIEDLLVGLPSSRAKSFAARLDTKRHGSRHARTDDGFDLDSNVAIDQGDDEGRERVQYARQGRSHRVMTGADPIGCVGVFWWVECGWMKTGGYFLG